MQIDKKGFIILSATVIVLVGVVFYWYNLQIMQESAPAVQTQATQVEDQSLGAAIYDSASNPVAGAETNALEDSGANPFDGYTNPFEN